MCAASKNCEKFTKNFFLGGSRSFKVINVNKSKKSLFLSPVLVIICSKSVLICNRFHTVRANTGKITFFKRDTHVLTLSFEGYRLTQRHEISSLKTEVLGGNPR